MWVLSNNQCPSDGTLNGAPCQGKQPSWNAKDRFTGFRRRLSSWGPPGTLQHFKTDHISLIVAAVTWLKYCQFGVKLYPINQSINQWNNQSNNLHCQTNAIIKIFFFVKGTPTDRLVYYSNEASSLWIPRSVLPELSSRLSS